MFKKMRGIKVPYERQGMIYFACRNYSDLDERTQAAICSFCRAAVQGDEVYFSALFDFLTKDMSATRVSMRYCVSESQLYRFRAKFYEAWNKELDVARAHRRDKR